MNAQPQTVEDTLDDLRLDALLELAQLIESYGRSAAEAAWRGDKVTLGVHLRQARLCLITALQTFRELCPENTAETGGSVPENKREPP
jgi:hypothetical protein